MLRKILNWLRRTTGETTMRAEPPQEETQREKTSRINDAVRRRLLEREEDRILEQARQQVEEIRRLRRQQQ